MGEWREVKFGELSSVTRGSIAIGPFGSRMKADCYVEQGVPVIRGTNISDTQAWKGDWVYVSDETADSMPNCNVRSGDLVFPHRGSIGEVMIIPGDQPRYMLSTSLMKFTPDLKKVVPLYLYYYFKSPLGRHEILTFSSQVGTPGIGQPLTSMKQFRVLLPSLSEQHVISSLLGALDNKIDLNRRMNETLEAMIRAIFKDWFVDFGPVRAKAEGYQPPGLSPEIAALFPDALDDDDKPVGWVYRPFGKLLESTIGGDWGKEAPDEKHTEQVAIIRGTDLPTIKSGLLKKVPQRFVESKKLEKRRLADGDIVIEVSGGSPTQPTGRSIYLSFKALKRFEKPVVPASFCRRFRPINPAIGVLLASYLDYLYRDGGTWAYQNQSTGIANFQTKYFLENEQVVVPPQQVIETFYDTVRPIINKTQTNENVTLARLRDMLLPKLMSGEIRVKDAEKEVEAVL